MTLNFGGGGGGWNWWADTHLLSYFSKLVYASKTKPPGTSLTHTHTCHLFLFYQIKFQKIATTTTTTTLAMFTLRLMIKKFKSHQQQLLATGVFDSWTTVAMVAKNGKSLFAKSNISCEELIYAHQPPVDAVVVWRKRKKVETRRTKSVSTSGHFSHHW